MHMMICILPKWDYYLAEEINNLTQSFLSFINSNKSYFI